MSIFRCVIPSFLLLLMACGCSSESSTLDQEAVARGEVLAKDCSACHSLSGKYNMVGPYLVGVYGRKAGDVQDYKYSSAMKSVGFEWTSENLIAFLQSPSKVVPGTKMAYDELSVEQARDITEYLKSL